LPHPRRRARPRKGSRKNRSTLSKRSLALFPLAQQMASPLPHADFSAAAVADVMAAESSLDVARRLGALLGIPLVPMDGAPSSSSSSSSSSSVPEPLTRLSPSDPRGELLVELYAACLQECRSLGLGPAKAALALSLTQDALAEISGGGWSCGAAGAAAVWERLLAARAAASTGTRASSTSAHGGEGHAEEGDGPVYFRASEARGLTDWADRHGWLRHFDMYRRALLAGGAAAQRGKRVALTVHVETPMPPPALEGAELITTLDEEGEEGAGVVEEKKDG
jgi:hypothetical protein